MIDLLAAIGSPGSGETHIRAYIAAIVGPQRIVFGQSNPHTVGRIQPVEVARNGSRTGQAAYVTVALRADQGFAAPVEFVVTNGRTSAATSTPVRLESNGAPNGIYQFSTVLLPSDQIFMQLTDPTIGNAEVDVVASSVYV